jgi:hypothetical protein
MIPSAPNAVGTSSAGPSGKRTPPYGELQFLSQYVTSDYLHMHLNIHSGNWL